VPSPRLRAGRPVAGGERLDRCLMTWIQAGCAGWTVSALRTVAGPHGPAAHGRPPRGAPAVPTGGPARTRSREAEAVLPDGTAGTVRTAPTGIPTYEGSESDCDGIVTFSWTTPERPAWRSPPPRSPAGRGAVRRRRSAPASRGRPPGPSSA